MLLFRDVLFGGRVFYDRDVHLLWHAQAQTFVRSVAGGSWPLWNPYPAFGQPLFALPYFEAAYPFTWLNLVLTPGPYYTSFVVAHVLLAAGGTYAFARRLSLSHVAAAAAACLWSVSGPFLCLVNSWHQLAGMAFLPWIFLAGDRAAERRRPWDAFLWGLAIAAALLAGSPEAAALGGLGSAVHALRHVGRAAAAASEAGAGAGVRPVLIRMGLTAALAAVFAIGIAAIQWLPTLEVAQRSARGRLDEAARAYWSLHPAGLADAVLPFFLHQWPLAESHRAAMFESREPLLGSLYLGLPTLALVVASAGASRRWSWRLLALLTLLAVAAALGRHTPVFDVLGWAVPPLRALRYPVKAMTLAALGWALLAGFGVEAWREGLGRRLRKAVVATAAVSVLAAGASAFVLRHRAEAWGAGLLVRPGLVSIPDALGPAAGRSAVAAGVAALAVAIAIAASRGRRARAGAMLVAAIAVGELAWAHRDLNPTAPASFYAYRSSAATAILSEPHGRVYTFDYFIAGSARRHLGRDAGFVFADPSKWPYPWAGALALRTYPFPPVLAAWGLESGFERDHTALYSPHAMALARALREVEGTPAFARLLRLGGVTHVVSLHSSGLEDLVPVATFESPFPEPIRLFRVPDPLPPALVVGGSRIGDGAAALEVLMDGRFDPRMEVLLPEGQAHPSPPGFQGSSRIVERRFDRVTVEARLGADGYVVLLDGYDPGWRATVDGQPAPVLRANGAFRALAVPAGEHRVELRYRPAAVLWGIGLTLAAVVGGVLLRPARGGRAAAET